MLTHFCDKITSHGVENIPQSGPLLVVTNHPGSYDGMVLFSQMPRLDIRWISSEIPFLRLLPNLQGNLFFSSREDARDRMVVLRNCIKHMQAGGVLVYFAAGHRDPDPAIYPGALRAIDGWLDIFDVFYKYVPELRVIPAIMSGVVDKYWSKHPLTWLRRKQIDQQRLAEFGQVITQLVHPGRLMLSPFISFGQPHTQSDLLKVSLDGTLRTAITQKGKQLLNEHCERFGGNAD
jgi:1-acyl-sn-glycerol-3-phosphate acyltransferase